MKQLKRHRRRLGPQGGERFGPQPEVLEDLLRHIGLLDAGDEPHRAHNNENTSGHRHRRPASAARPNPGDTATAPTSTSSTSATLPATTGAVTSATPAARRVVQRHQWSTVAGGRPWRAGGSSVRRRRRCGVPAASQRDQKPERADSRSSSLYLYLYLMPTVRTARPALDRLPLALSIRCWQLMCPAYW